MKKGLRSLIWICLTAFVLEFAPACATITYVRPAPPPPRREVRPAKPHRKAVWVKGHWKWRGRRKGYVWVPGHWKRIH